MNRCTLIVMDSVGIGGASDADQYYNGEIPDTGANTLGHIAAARAAQGRPLNLPNLARMGIWHAAAQATGAALPAGAAQGKWGAATAVSRGKDTPSGHWELAGVPVPWDWYVFPHTCPAFPEDITRAVCAAADVDGILGNCHASGTEIIARLGAEHVRTGWPICYTSADSVFQIAAHEETFGLDRLLTLCAALAPMLHALPVGRVIARPFAGAPGDFRRTGNRKDFAVAPPAPVLSEWAQEAGRNVHGIGKVGDIFSMRGFGTLDKGSDAELMDALFGRYRAAADGALIFANLVEFDSLFGHRRDVDGYARHLEWFDTRLGALMAALREGDALIVTADHGNDPTWAGTDHTRERVPVLVWGSGAGPLGPLGFADVARLASDALGLEPR